MVTTATRQRLAAALTSQRAAKEILDLLAGGYTYDVTKYGAAGDGVTEDTVAIQAAFDAAAASALSGIPPVVFFPEGTYIVGSSTVATSGIDGAVTISGSGIHVLGHGILKLAAGSNADCALHVSGSYNRLEELTIDGNTSGSPGGRGDCFYISGNYNTAHNITCQNSKSTSGIDFLITDSALGNQWVNCISRNAGYNAFDNRGSYTKVQNCHGIDFRNHGFNQAGGFQEELTIDGLFLNSSSTFATESLIIDPGNVSGNYLNKLTLRNIRILDCPGANNFIKIARCHYITIDNVYVIHTDQSPSITFVEGIKSLKISNSYFSRAINFDESGGVTGSISSVAESLTTAGRARFTCSGSHGLLVGDTVYIVATGYTGLHEVLAIPGSTTFETNYQWTNSTATGNFYQCTGEVILDTVTVGDGTHDVFTISGIRTPKLTMRNCRVVTNNSTKLIAAKQTYPLTAIERYDVENCEFEFNLASTDAVVLSDEGSTDFFATSRKIRWVNNAARNRGYSGVTAYSYKLTKSTDSDILLTSLDGGRDFIASAVNSGTAVTWQVGDRFWKPSPAASASPGWICTTAGTFSGGSAGVFSAMANLA